MTSSGSPYSTGWPSSTKIAVTVPARGAVMSLKVFIASMRRSLSPASTLEPTSTKFFASGDGAAHGLEADGAGDDLVADHEGRGAGEAELVAEADVLLQRRLHLRRLH